MEQRVYNSNLEELLEFITDIKTQFSLNVTTKDVINRASKSYSQGYDSTLVSSYSGTITPTFNVVHYKNEKESLIAAYIPAITIGLKLKYMKSSATCAFQFNLPQTRIIKKCKDSELSAYISDFYKCEEFVESIVEEYLRKKTHELFAGQIESSEKSDAWYVKCPSHSLEIIKCHV